MLKFCKSVHGNDWYRLLNSLLPFIIATSWVLRKVMTTVPRKCCRKKTVLRFSLEIGKPTALLRPNELGFSWSWCR